MSEDIRITFRPTGEILNRINKLMRRGKYLKKSDLIRDVIWEGLDVVEKR